ncbi:MAG TPA: hypothetical protein PLM79_01080 [Syntrophobacteraceae bacterium]|nr:hypothetical protein [Syntrophobacteraceae bacterium]
MDIILGTNPVKGSHPRTTASGGGTTVEARILYQRPCRKSRGTPPSGQRERRHRRSLADPPNGRVVFLLVPEGNRLPRDLSNANYRVFLRLVPGSNP